MEMGQATPAKVVAGETASGTEMEGPAEMDRDRARAATVAPAPELATVATAVTPDKRERAATEEMAAQAAAMVVWAATAALLAALLAAMEERAAMEAPERRLMATAALVAVEAMRVVRAEGSAETVAMAARVPGRAMGAEAATAETVLQIAGAAVAGAEDPPQAVLEVTEGTAEPVAALAETEELAETHRVAPVVMGATAETVEQAAATAAKVALEVLDSRPDPAAAMARRRNPRVD